MSGQRAPLQVAYIYSTKRCRKCRSLIVASIGLPSKVTARFNRKGAASCYYCDRCIGKLVSA